MKRFSRDTIFAVMTALTLSACGFYHEKKRENLSLTQLNLDEVSYAKVDELVFRPKCLRCHSSSNPSDGVSLDSYANLKLFSKELQEVTLISKTMPKDGSLTETESSLLEKWFKAGMPEFSSPSTDPSPLPAPAPSPDPLPTNTPTPLPTETPSPPPPMLPTFSSIRTNIFERKCTSCHSVGSSAEKVPLIDYVELINSPRELIIPGTPDDSGLVIAVEREDRRMMPPPTSGVSRLDEPEKTAIRKWILDGALNN